MTPSIPFRRTVSPGLTVAVDSSGCVVIESERPIHTVTNIDALVRALHDARGVAQVATASAP